MKKFALIGENISYSLSPRVHSMIFDHIDVRADYSLISLSQDELKDNIGELRRLDGFNVTQPHKSNIIGFLDENRSPFNAVNTVKCDNDRLIGYNTDEYGFRTHIRECLDGFENRTAVVLGAGGMAEIAVAVLAELGADVYIMNRTHQKAQDLAARYGAKALQAAGTIAPEIVVNCSSRGLYEYSYQFPQFNRSRLALAYDSIYLDTAFSRSAKAYGVKTVNGLRMLIYQALKADEIFLETEIKDMHGLCGKIEKQLLKEGI